jgi:glutamate N-acetyltransferase/amino-acid N-acetyltransferase
MVAMTRSAALLKRFSSSIAVKPTPSKVHFHRPIPDSAFPKGYLLTGMHCGIKRDAQALDLGLILSTSKRPAAVAASFTQNAFKAAPVLVSQDVIAQGGGRARSVVISSGCANAVTGPNGVRDAMAMSKAADALHENKGDGHGALVMSTGVIGMPLPIDNILTGITSLKNHTSSLGSGFDAWERTARAFMTTDTFPKVRARTFTINGVDFRIAGIDKGAGMLHPVMGPPPAPHATLLACILTDVPIVPRCLQSALNYAVERSFNSISVDGDMSTNDTVFVLANGAAVDGAAMEDIDSEKHPEAYKVFRTELTALAVELAQLLVRDGEGATKFVTINVEV